MTIEDLLIIEEGFRAKPYYCSEGYPTIGIGQKIGNKNQPLSDFEGTTTTISAAKIELKKEIGQIKETLIKYGWYNGLNEERKIIIQSMAY